MEPTKEKTVRSYTAMQALLAAVIVAAALLIRLLCGSTANPIAEAFRKAMYGESLTETAATLLNADQPSQNAVHV